MDSKDMVIIQLLIVLGVGFWIFMMIAGLYCFVKNEQLYKWLKKNYCARWENLTTAETRWGETGPGIVNAKKHWAYIYGDQDNENETILKFKRSIRVGLRYVGICLAASLISMGMAIALIFTT